MTAELSTAMPDNGGYSLWVQAAFGDFWACRRATGRGSRASSTRRSTRCCSTRRRCSSSPAPAVPAPPTRACAAANATLPASLAHGGARRRPPPPPPLWSCSCKTLWLCLLRGGCALELSGSACSSRSPRRTCSSKAVGLSVSLLGVLMAPFVVMVALAILDPSLLLLAPKKYDVGKLASLVWNLSGFDPPPPLRARSTRRTTRTARAHAERDDRVASSCCRSSPRWSTRRGRAGARACSPPSRSCSAGRGSAAGSSSPSPSATGGCTRRSCSRTRTSCSGWPRGVAPRVFQRAPRHADQRDPHPARRHLAPRRPRL